MPFYLEFVYSDVSVVTSLKSQTGKHYLYLMPKKASLQCKHWQCNSSAKPTTAQFIDPNWLVLYLWLEISFLYLIPQRTVRRFCILFGYKHTCTTFWRLFSRDNWIIVKSTPSSLPSKPNDYLFLKIQRDLLLAVLGGLFTKKLKVNTFPVWWTTGNRLSFVCKEFWNVSAFSIF